MGVVVDDEEDDKDNNNDSNNDDEYDKDDHLSHRGSPIHFLSNKNRTSETSVFSQARLMWPATSVVSKVSVVFSSGAGRVTGWMGGFVAGCLVYDWLVTKPRER